ncbi:MAG: helix-turn-helix transcriptional regulator [Rhizobiaceae bacterium]|nr:helix-turn-helix transcriptional regulator [Rhizobiaceae bacterium]
MNIREILAANLRRLRKLRGFSQEELAHRANIHRTYVSSLERCQYAATIDMVDSLAVILGVEAADLLSAKAGQPPGNRAPPKDAAV